MTEKEQTEVTKNLVYAHDPMCSWCWGIAPTFDRVKGQLPDDIELVMLLGGLAPDSDQPMPQQMRQYLQQTWQTIEAQIPGTSFNHDFWTQCEPRRSTYPACRAVIAARLFGPDMDQKMTRAIQQAYYLQAKNPSDNETLIGLADELGLDTEKFAEVLTDDNTHQQLLQEITLVQRLGVQGFPSMVLISGQDVRPIRVRHGDPDGMLEDITRFA